MLFRSLWSLVGYCHLRKGVRTFHVHRIRRLTVNTRSPRAADFEIPKTFKLEDYVATWPWQVGVVGVLADAPATSGWIMKLTSSPLASAMPHVVPPLR